jgi:putative nucleotidyltransferase with HDIG domain
MMDHTDSVLIVDDEPAVRELMAQWVASLGLSATTAGSADEALETLETRRCDLAVIDVMMPGRDGLWLAGELSAKHPHTAVILATAHSGLLDGAADAQPVADLLIKPFARERFALAVDRGRRWRKQILDEVRWHAQLSRELQERTDRVCADLAHAADGDEAGYLIALARERTPDTMAHSERVARYAVSLAAELGYEGPIDEVDAAARLHDVGKIAVPEALLTKPSPLTPGEQVIMRRHVDAGAEILAASRTLQDLAPVVLATHEWYGGGGYPLQLAHDAIPPASRLIAVCDAYDAMTQDRDYRRRLDSNDAISELLRCRDTQFDPVVVAGFLKLLSKH